MKNRKLLTTRCLLVAPLMLISILFARTASAVPVPNPNKVYDSTYIDMYLKNFPANLSEQDVYLDAAESNSITGHVGSQTGTILVNFSSTTDTLDAANGFSTIKASDDYINNITITVPGYYFGDLIFSVSLDQNIVDLNMAVTAVDQEGNSVTYSGWTTASGWGNGENKILVLADVDGHLMKSITINSPYGIIGVGGGLDQVKQTQISGLTPVPTPEPASALLLGAALIGVAVLRKRF